MVSHSRGTAEKTRKKWSEERKLQYSGKNEEMVARQIEPEIYLAFSIRECNDNNNIGEKMNWKEHISY